jgi:DNA-binding MarR family transcriptional regulator
MATARSQGAASSGRRTGPDAGLLDSAAAGTHRRPQALTGGRRHSPAAAGTHRRLRLEINRTIMIKLIDRLQEAGYVTRTRNPDNRRSYVLSLTGPGRKALEEMRRPVHGARRAPDRQPEPKERERLNDLLRTVLGEPEKTPGTLSTGYLITQVFYLLRRRGDAMVSDVGLRVRSSLHSPRSASSVRAHNSGWRGTSRSPNRRRHRSWRSWFRPDSWHAVRIRSTGVVMRWNSPIWAGNGSPRCVMWPTVCRQIWCRHWAARTTEEEIHTLPTSFCLPKLIARGRRGLYPSDTTTSPNPLRARSDEPGAAPGSLRGQPMGAARGWAVSGVRWLGRRDADRGGPYLGVRLAGSPGREPGWAVSGGALAGVAGARRAVPRSASVASLRRSRGLRLSRRRPVARPRPRDLGGRRRMAAQRAPRRR